MAWVSGVGNPAVGRMSIVNVSLPRYVKSRGLLAISDNSESSVKVPLFELQTHIIPEGGREVLHRD